jgi:aldehyde:ferredoxin oxidoreductase
MPNGYHGKILHVNLTDRTLATEEPPEAFYRMYMGGSALNLHLRRTAVLYMIRDCYMREI